MRLFLLLFLSDRVGVLAMVLDSTIGSKPDNVDPRVRWVFKKVRGIQQ